MYLEFIIEWFFDILCRERWKYEYYEWKKNEGFCAIWVFTEILTSKKQLLEQ